MKGLGLGGKAFFWCNETPRVPQKVGFLDKPLCSWRKGGGEGIGWEKQTREGEREWESKGPERREADWETNLVAACAERLKGRAHPAVCQPYCLGSWRNTMCHVRRYSIFTSAIIIFSRLLMRDKFPLAHSLLFDGPAPSSHTSARTRTCVNAARKNECAHDCARSQTESLIPGEN